MSNYDLVIKGATVVIPNHGLIKADLGIKGEKIGPVRHRRRPVSRGSKRIKRYLKNSGVQGLRI